MITLNSLLTHIDNRLKHLQNILLSSNTKEDDRIEVNREMSLLGQLRGIIALYNIDFMGRLDGLTSDIDMLNRFQDNVYGTLRDINEDLDNKQKTALRDIGNKKRMVQINTYYSKKYADYIYIAKLTILLCAIIIILSMLVRRSIISNGLYSILIGVCCFVIITTIIYTLISMRYRDQIDYSKYNFYIPPDKSNKSRSSAGKTTIKLGYGVSPTVDYSSSNELNMETTGDEAGSGAGSGGSSNDRHSKGYSD